MADLIDPRADETIDISRLAGWIADLPNMPSGVPEISQFSGGRANLTYLLAFSDGSEVVLRRPPHGPVAPGSHDMSREYQVLSRLWREFPLAPRALALCEQPEVIGSPFFLMERKPGVVVRDRIPESFGGGSNQTSNRTLSSQVVVTLARLHQVDPEACNLGDLGRPEGFLERQVNGWRRRLDGARVEPTPEADRIGEWLAAELPFSPPPTLIHNDWRIDNMAFDPSDPGRCVAVYDWDMATRGDPLADLGTLLATWNDPGEPGDVLNGLSGRTPGWLRRQEAIELYLAHTDYPSESIGWYVVFGTWKLGIILQQIYLRWHRGQTNDQRFATMGNGARELFRLAQNRRM